MSKRMTVEEHYARGRSYPTIPRNTDEGAENSIKREPSFESGNRPGRAFNTNVNQDAEDAHDNSRTARYDNDHANNWVRGGGEDATSKPGYDHNPVWKRANKGNDWNSPGDKVELRPAGDENEWAKRRK